MEKDDGNCVTFYYYIAAYNGEKAIIVTGDENSDIVRLDKESTLSALKSESRNSDMAALDSYKDGPTIKKLLKSTNMMVVAFRKKCFWR